MKRKYRKILFISFFLFFFIVAPILTFRSQGYRIDFENKRIIQTGGLYFKINPKEASVYLNNEFVKKTDFLFNSILIENLLPQEYNVKIKKKDYITWEKNLTVKEKQVTEAAGITLFPQEFNFKSISNEVEDFWISPSEEKIIWKEVENNNWSLKLYNFNKELQSHLISEKDISRRKVDLINLTFSQDGEKIYLKVITAEQLKTFSLNIDKGPSTLKEEKQPQLKSEIITHQSFNNQNYYLTSSGYLYKTKEDLNSTSITDKEVINKTPFPVKAETPYHLFIFPEFIFLKEGNIVYLFNQGTKEFERLEEQIKNFKLSPDSKTIAYYINSEIWILPIKETKIYEAKEKVFLVRFSESIQNIFWINSNYLAFNTKNKVKITEIDTRDQLNIIDVGEFQSSEIFWSPITERLYVLTDKNLQQSIKLLP